MISKATSVYIIILLILAGVAEALCQDPDNDLDTRVGGVKTVSSTDDGDNTDAWASEETIEIPDFVRPEAIHMNGADWSAIQRKLLTGADEVSIVHIGDSHLQADIATRLVRELMQLEFGNAGRGLVAPLKLSGTNEPFNYIFRSDINWQTEKFMKYPWQNKMGFTGCGLYSNSPDGYIELSTSDKLDYNPFCEVRLFFSGSLKVTGVYDENDMPVGFDFIPDSRGGRIRLAFPTDHVRLSVHSPDPVSLYGAFLSADKAGVTYNVIGNNGATYSTYNRISDFGRGIAAMKPDLIIISLGCNEAFGVFNALSFSHQVEILVEDIRRENPDAQILLTTPMECHRRTTTRTRSGKGRRRRVVKSTSYSRNSRILEVRNALIAYGHSNGIPVYDLYNAAGGAGSSDKWVADGLFSRDHIHLSVKGYKLMGRMLFDALLTQLQP